MRFLSLGYIDGTIIVEQQLGSHGDENHALTTVFLRTVVLILHFSRSTIVLASCVDSPEDYCWDILPLGLRTNNGRLGENLGG